MLTKMVLPSTSTSSISPPSRFILRTDGIRSAASILRDALQDWSCRPEFGFFRFPRGGSGLKTSIAHARVNTSAGSLRSFVAGRAGAARLCVIGHILAANSVCWNAWHVRSSASIRSFAHQRAFLMIIAPIFTAIVGNGGPQGFRPITEQCIFSGGRPSR